MIDHHPEQLAEAVARFDAHVPTLVRQVNESRVTPEVKAQFAGPMDEARR